MISSTRKKQCRVIWNHGALGLIFRPARGTIGARIETIDLTAHAIGLGQLEIGVELIQVNMKLTCEMNFEDITKCIAASAKPIRLYFKPMHRDFVNGSTKLTSLEHLIQETKSMHIQTPQALLSETASLQSTASLDPEPKEEFYVDWKLNQPLQFVLSNHLHVRRLRANRNLDLSQVGDQPQVGDQLVGVNGEDVVGRAPGSIGRRMLNTKGDAAQLRFYRQKIAVPEFHGPRSARRKVRVQRGQAEQQAEQVRCSDLVNYPARRVPILGGTHV